MQDLGLERDDVIIPPFAVIVTVATRKFFGGENSITVLTGLMLPLRNY